MVCTNRRSWNNNKNNKVSLREEYLNTCMTVVKRIFSWTKSWTNAYEFNSKKLKCQTVRTRLNQERFYFPYYWFLLSLFLLSLLLKIKVELSAIALTLIWKLKWPNLTDVPRFGPDPEFSPVFKSSFECFDLVEHKTTLKKVLFVLTLKRKCRWDILIQYLVLFFSVFSHSLLLPFQFHIECYLKSFLITKTGVPCQRRSL